MTPGPEGAHPGRGEQARPLAEVAALFAGDRLRLARRLAGLRKSDLAIRIGRTPTAVAGYESGRTRPSPAAVGQLGLALAVEPAFFLPGPGRRAGQAGAVGGVEGNSFGPAHFRSLRSTSQLARDQALAYGQVVHDVVTALERHVEMPPVRLPVAPVSVDAAEAGGDNPDPRAPERSAQRLRELWGLGREPVPHLVRSAENHGVVCVFSPVQAAAVDAYSFATATRPIVVLNPLKGDYYRQRFDVAHELGHLVMHQDAEPGRRAAEVQANRFAAELLMPREVIGELLPRRLHWPALQALKEHWGVSLQALLLRARELGVLSDTTYRNAVARMTREGWRRREPGVLPDVEQLSLLPGSLRLLAETGLSAEALAAQARTPIGIFRTVTARRPAGSVDPAAGRAGQETKDPGESAIEP